jgi:two-component system CheB/CheR fusion protein
MATRARDLELAKEAAETANQTKDRFLAVLSHELRTPLTPVLTAAELLGSPFKLDPTEVKRQSDLIRRNILLEARLIDDLLDLTRISHGKLHLRLQPVDVRETMREAVQFCEEEAAKRKVRIESHFDAATHVIRADPARLLQLFWNILSNAVKYSNRGGCVSVRTASRDGRLSVAVSDEGLGMTADEIAHIFDPFRQTNTPLIPSSGGLELGLAIAKGLVEAHGGTLTARSEGKGKGAVFTADFPEVAVPPRFAPHEPAASGRTNGNTPQSILLVDDHQDTRRALGSLLERNGYEVVSASGVKEAVELSRTRRFDFLVSDISMPDGSGLELMEQLRPSGVRGIAISGFGTDDDQQRSRAAGFSEHITKPISFAVLEETLRRLSAAGSR